MSRDNKGDKVKDRLAGRFNSDESDETKSSNSRDNQDNTDNQDNIDNTSNLDTQIDPKEDWVGRMVYVPNTDDDTVAVTNLLESFDGEYDRLQYECDWKIRKQLHYYPVVVQRGVEEVKKMDGEEFTQAVSELGLSIKS